MFLGIFLSFLSISVLHSHNFNFQTKSQISDVHEKHVSDLFLDSELNCTINYLNNSLIIDSDNLDYSKLLFQKEQYLTSEIFNIPITKQFILFTLRGPPA